MRSIPILAVLALLAISAIGCSRAGMPRCDKQREYQASNSIDGVRVPADLNEPGRADTLVIPDVSPEARVRQKGDPCLETPPDYFVQDSEPT